MAEEPDNSRGDELAAWLENHNRLMAEFFDDQRKLLGDLYGCEPSKPVRPSSTEPRRARAPWGSRYPTLARWGSDLAEFGRVLGVVVLVTAAVVWANWVLSIFGR